MKKKQTTTAMVKVDIVIIKTLLRFKAMIVIICALSRFQHLRSYHINIAIMMLPYWNITPQVRDLTFHPIIIL